MVSPTELRITPLPSKEVISLNAKLCENYHSQIIQPHSLDSKLGPKKYGLGRNMLNFSRSDQALYDSSEEGVVSQFRHISGILYSPDENPNATMTTSCNLRHLYNVLHTQRSIIPDHKVWSKAVYRTIDAFNNVNDCQD